MAATAVVPAAARAVEAVISAVKSPGTLARLKGVTSSLGARLGVAASKLTPTNLIAMARKDPLTTGFILYEAYGLGNDALEALMNEDPNVASAIRAISMEVDEIKDEEIGESKHLDEFQVISDAIATVGTLERLLVLKQALDLSVRHFVAYKSYRDSARRLR